MKWKIRKNATIFFTSPYFIPKYMDYFFWISRYLFICSLYLLQSWNIFLLLLSLTVILTSIYFESAMCRDYKQIIRNTRWVAFQVSKKNTLCLPFWHLVSAYRTAYLEPKFLPNVFCAISTNLTDNAQMLVNELLVIRNTTGHNYWLLLSESVLWWIWESKKFDHSFRWPCDLK